MRVADAVLRLLRDEGVDRVFGNPGTTELPLLDAIAADGALQYVLGSHEGALVAMADGYARATRRPTFVNLHVAAGVANGLIGMLNARRSHTPLVITAGQQDSRHLVQDPMLSGDLVGLASSATKWAVEVRRADEVLTVLRRAFRAAQAPPAGPVFVSIPMDLLEHEANTDFPLRTPVILDMAAAGIEQAADMLRSALRPAIVAGDGVGRAAATDELVAVAEHLGAAVFHQPMFDRVDFPLTHPQYLGMLPPDNAAIRKALESYDVVFLAGARAFAPHHYTPEAALAPPSVVVQLDDDAGELGRNYSAQVTLLGGIRPTLRLLADALRDSTPPSDRLTAIRSEARHRHESHARGLSATPAHVPLEPRTAAATFAEVLPSDAILVEEAITVGLLVRESLRLTNSDSFHHTVGGGLGWGLGAAAGVAMGSPGRRVFAALGDGSALFGVHGLWIAARYGLPVTAVVFANSEYRTLKQTLAHMQSPGAMSGRFVGLDLDRPQLAWADVARAFGVDGIRIESDAELRTALTSRTSTDGPLVIEVGVRSFAQDSLHGGEGSIPQ